MGVYLQVRALMYRVAAWGLRVLVGIYGYYSIMENHMEKLKENERKAGII